MNSTGRGFYFSLVFVLLGVPTQVFAEPPIAPQLKTHNAETTPRIIREIRIEVRDVFDQPDLGLFYSTVDKLKISTKESIVKRELLFKEGDTFDPFLIAESERALRRISFLREASIVGIPDGDVIDIKVSVQDTWTLFPFINLATGGGTNKSSVGIAETDLLGYGKRAEVLYADDEGREKVEGVWDDQRLFGSYQQLTMGYFDRSDGWRAVGFYGRPFRTLVDPYSWSVNVDDYDLVDKIFHEGDEHVLFRESHQSLTAGFTQAYGDPEDRVSRMTLGYDYSASRFKPPTDEDFNDVNVSPDTVSHDPALIPSNRIFSGPFAALQLISPDFISLNFADRFGRVEDYNLGNEFYGRLTSAFYALGSERDTLLLNVADSAGHRFSPTSFMRGKVGLQSRVDSDSVSNSTLTADARYYYVLGAKYLGDTYIGKHTLVASFSGNFSDRLDRDKQLLLGASNGLRGYEDRSLDGSQTLLLNLEDRAFFLEDVYHLVDVGSAIFIDCGGVSNNGWGDILSDELRTDIGFGLRIGFPRSSGNSVLRIDLAFPLRDGPGGTEQFAPRLLFSTGQVVNAKLPNESDQSPGSNVTVRFLP